MRRAGVRWSARQITSPAKQITLTLDAHANNRLPYPSPVPFMVPSFLGVSAVPPAPY